MKSLINFTLAALILLLTINLVLNSCSEIEKEKSIPSNFSINPAEDRSANTFTVESTDSYGNCWVFVFQRQANNSLTYQKIPVSCPTGNNETSNLIIETPFASFSNGKLALTNGVQYWLIPIDEGNQPLSINGGEIYCFCEGGDVSNDELCTGIPSRCMTSLISNPWSRKNEIFCDNICCDAGCDRGYCPDPPLCGSFFPIFNGILVDAVSLNFIQNSFANSQTQPSYISDNFRITIITNENLKTLIRSKLNSNFPKYFYNLTPIQANGNELSVSNSINTWFVPFQDNAQAICLNALSTPEPKCISGEIGCRGECELTPDPNRPNCLICDCNTKPGDCDMEISGIKYKNGIIIQSENILLKE